MASRGFKRLKFGDTGRVHRHAGKGATEQRLPSRSALNSLTKGDPAARSMSDYAKVTPGPDVSGPDINQMGSEFTDYMG